MRVALRDLDVKSLNKRPSGSHAVITKRARGQEVVKQHPATATNPLRKRASPPLTAIAQSVAKELKNVDESMVTIRSAGQLSANVKNDARFVIERAALARLFSLSLSTPEDAIITQCRMHARMLVLSRSFEFSEFNQKLRAETASNTLCFVEGADIRQARHSSPGCLAVGSALASLTPSPHLRKCYLLAKQFNAKKGDLA